MASFHSSNRHRRCYSNPNLTTHPEPALLVFSGGTAFNGVVEDLKNFTTRVAHVLPVSDDGGSTAEIVRVLGGPAVGDIRSRCLRLSDQSTAEALAVRNLLGHRLTFDPLQAKSEWYSIVEGDHFLWEGARIFFQSLDAAIFLFSRVSDIPPDSLVLPVISTNDRLTLGCELWDGTVIRGQNEISHPTSGTMEPVNKVFPSPNAAVLEQLNSVDCIVYAMGSLFTSVCPSLVLMLNGTHDRETNGFLASSFVTAITDALNRTYGDPSNHLNNPPSQYINTLLVPRNSAIPVDVDCLAAQGIFDVIVVDSLCDSKVGIIYDPKSLIRALADLIDRYVKTRVNGLIDTT
ncbi:hypothetical protein TanjilG_08058 [Lupinus angustifolius]|uniref:LPPG:FO 2-phospho-L-lactate transferase CofD/UPF0052 n=1 Tax=Lupinus angustifolius TaxID=3871 RepID=A0A4P1RM70_LUPAN|nr:hypothetical protein TanjilG_08058 [Lupinus angustifolius]